MKNAVKLKIKTLSNLFIGGAPLPFEIGGIDQQTALDQEGLPCIPGSSLKGALRAIIREDSSDMEQEIKQLYKAYLEKDRADNWERIQEIIHKEEKSERDKEEALKRIRERYEEADKKLSQEYLFGIEGFNNSPKLLFNDLRLCSEFRNKEKCFSIDMKNSIDAGGEAPVSNPRTYRTARCGLVFEGEIRLYKIDALGGKALELCERYIEYNLMKFNDGIHRLGNSKSRGYGKIEVIIEKEGED